MTLLVFCAGSVIFITGTDSIYQVKGIRKKLPVTFWTMLVGLIAASGIYPFSGFFGKIGIVWEPYQRGHAILFLIAFIVFVVQAIVLFRVLGLTFFGKKRLDEDSPRLEESSTSMLVMMVILAFTSFVVGWLGVGEAFGGDNLFREWLEPSLATQMVHVLGEGGRFSEFVIAIILVLITAHAGLITWIVYVQKRAWPDSLSKRFSRTFNLLQNGYYINSVYDHVLVKPVKFVGDSVLFKGLDNLVIDKVFVDSVPRVLGFFSDLIGRANVRRFSTYIVCLIILVVIVFALIIF